MKEILKLNKNIYSYEDIIDSVNEYKSVADVNVSDDSEYFICIFENCRYDTQETLNEFENYVIRLSNIKE